MILAGDIGGTNTRLGLFEQRGERIAAVITRTYPSREYDGLAKIVSMFTAGKECRISAACFAIAGPVSEGRVATTNLAWLVDGEQLSRALDLPAVQLINDLEAIGHGLADLAPEDIAAIAGGVDRTAGDDAE